jgi:hypothetical protein
MRCRTCNGSSKSGDGDDKQAGNKGKSNGDGNSRGYNGGGGSEPEPAAEMAQTESSEKRLRPGTGSGSGGGNGWKLNGRKLANSSKQVQDCNESGTVVVSKNRNGNVIATKYTKGTTNTSSCLVEPAYATARSYKWQPDPNAPEVQTGTITVNFKLGE